ncbi:MAG: hypothetical protein GXO60_08950 [Epsilonproteobacteria bacterium]|nr:hypothetical protein [Campylobacterota bacterium]
MRINIENILKSPQKTFLDIIDKLTTSDIKHTKKELKIDNTQIDEVLVDAIEMVLRDLNNEEGYISRLLYSIFKFEIRKNKRREQLIILGSQLKSQYNELKKDIYRVKVNIGNISATIENLKRLQQAFDAKEMFLYNQKLLDKNRLYINILDKKIEQLYGYKEALDERLQRLYIKGEKYKKLFKKIPRYHELSEDIYLQLTR